MSLSVEGPVLWKPTEEQIANSKITRFQNWLEQYKNISISNIKEIS
jgi:acetoacetyl-CoA synthetase